MGRKSTGMQKLMACPPWAAAFATKPPVPSHLDPEHRDYWLLRHIYDPQAGPVVVLHVADTLTPRERLQQDSGVLRGVPRTLQRLVESGHPVVLAGGPERPDGTQLCQLVCPEEGVAQARPLPYPLDLPQSECVRVLHAAFPQDGSIILWYADFFVEQADVSGQRDELVLNRPHGSTLEPTGPHLGPRIHRRSRAWVYNLPKPIFKLISEGTQCYLHGYPSTNYAELNRGYRSVVHVSEGDDRGINHGRVRAEDPHPFEIRGIPWTYRPSFYPHLMWRV